MILEHGRCSDRFFVLVTIDKDATITVYETHPMSWSDFWEAVDALKL